MNLYELVKKKKKLRIGKAGSIVIKMPDTYLILIKFVSLSRNCGYYKV